MEKICVVVRVRPSISLKSFNRAYWNVKDNRISLHRLHSTPVFGLSYTFGTHSYVHLSLSLSLIEFCCNKLLLLLLLNILYYNKNVVATICCNKISVVIGYCNSIIDHYK